MSWQIDMTDIRHAARIAVDCPYCGQPAGSMCVSKSGRRVETHSQRVLEHANQEVIRIYGIPYVQ